MTPLTENQVRAGFLNASRREAAEATLPDLADVPWERRELLGWRDRKAPLQANVVVELDGAPAGVLLRAADPAAGPRRKAVCTWCHDLVATDVSLYVARRAGAPGRQGNTLGTLVCTAFTCSQNVRRPPTSADAGQLTEAERVLLIEQRRAGLAERAQRFVREVGRTR